MLTDREFVQIIISSIGCLSKYKIHISVNNINILFKLIVRFNPTDFPDITDIRDIPISKYNMFLDKIKTWSPNEKMSSGGSQKLRLVVNNTKGLSNE